MLPGEISIGAGSGLSPVALATYKQTLATWKNETFVHQTGYLPRPPKST